MPGVKLANPASSTVAPTTTIAAVPTSSTTTIPDIATASPGQAVLVINGATSPSEVTRVKNQLVITSGSMKATIGSLDKMGKTAALDENGNVVLRPGDRIRLRVSGLLPNSLIDAWIFSQPSHLGTTKVDADGAVVTNYIVPKKISNGSHRIALTAKLVDKKEATFTIGIRVSDFKKALKVPVWLIALPLVLAIGFALFLPPAIRRRKRTI
jgi:hypothetical protein